MKKMYNKLIRDRIPEIIYADGKQAQIEIMSESEYRNALLEKLVEEAQEAAKAQDDELVLELADIYEVIDAILVTWNISKNEVTALQIKRRHLFTRQSGFRSDIAGQ